MRHTHFRYILLFVIACLCSLSAVGKTRYDIHLVGVYGGAGYSGMLNQYEQSKFIGGGGGFLGVNYEYQYKKFMLEVGPEFRLFSSQDNLLYDEPFAISLTDYNGYPQTKFYRFSNLQETQLLGQVMLPIMAGGNFGKFYFLAGAKVGYTLLGRYTQKANLTTSIVDEGAYEEWFDMPSHNLETDAPYKAKGKNPFGFDATLSAEVGVNIDQLMSREWQKRNEDKAKPLRMRLSAFVDYGLPNMNICNDAAFATPQPEAISTTSLHQSIWATSRVNSLLVGVKFAALFQLNKPKKQVSGKAAQNPRIATQVINAETGKGLQNIRVNIYREQNKRNMAKVTNQKGYVIARLAPGGYRLSASSKDYLPSDTIRVEHATDLQDTIILALQPLPYYTCYVRDAKTNKFVAAKLEFVDNSTKQVAFTQHTDSLTGKARLRLNVGSTYTLNISAPEYLHLTAQVSDIAAVDNLLIEPIVRGKKVVIQNLFFATNKTTILPTSEGALQDLADFLKENPDVRIRIIGHTDAVGTDEFNQRLSEGRAKSVKRNIVERGIDASRIETEGRGKREPIATNETEEGRAQNRRVEFVIL